MQKLILYFYLLYKPDLIIFYFTGYYTTTQYSPVYIIDHIFYMKNTYEYE